MSALDGAIHLVEVFAAIKLTACPYPRFSSDTSSRAHGCFSRTISGERKTEAEENKEDFYRSERQFGSFYRSVPLPEGAKVEDVKATFSDGVLEVSVPLPAAVEAKVRKVEIQDAVKAAKPAA